MEIREYIKNALNQHIAESKAYDEMLELERWYKEEKRKIDANEKDVKIWKIKKDRLFKDYVAKKNIINKKENPYGLEGDMKSNYIYHYTNGDSLINMIDDNEMIGGGDDYGGISFTSNPNLYKRGFIFWYPSEYSKGKTHNNIGIKMKFDFNKMKSDGLKFKKGSEHIGTHMGEDELRLRGDELENPFKYLVEIIIFKDKEEKYMDVSNYLKDNNIKYKIV